MSRKPQVRHIVQPKSKSRAEQLKFLAELRGEVQKRPQKTFNVKKFLIISAVVVALSLAVVFFAGYRLNAIDAYNQQVEETGQGTINTSSPIYAILRLVALIEQEEAAAHPGRPHPGEWLGRVAGPVTLVHLCPPQGGRSGWRGTARPDDCALDPARSRRIALTAYSPLLLR